jgi:hypothetical protein
VDARPVVEHDREDVLGVRAKVMHEKGAGSSLRLPGEQVQTIPGLVGSQPIPFTARVVGVGTGRPIPELARPARSGTDCRRRHAGHGKWVHNERYRFGDGDRLTEQGKGVVDPES